MRGLQASRRAQVFCLAGERGGRKLGAGGVAHSRSWRAEAAHVTARAGVHKPDGRLVSGVQRARACERAWRLRMWRQWICRKRALCESTHVEMSQSKGAGDRREIQRVTLQGPKGKNKNSRLDREVSGGPGCALRFPAYEGAMIAAVAHQQRPHWQWPENLLRAPDAGLFC